MLPTRSFCRSACQMNVSNYILDSNFITPGYLAQRTALRPSSFKMDHLKKVVYFNSILIFIGQIEHFYFLEGRGVVPGYTEKDRECVFSGWKSCLLGQCKYHS